MLFKCPSCGERTINYRSKVKLLFGGSVQCSECRSALTTGWALTMYGVTATLLVMGGGPLFFLVYFREFGVAIPLIMFSSCILALFFITAAICTLRTQSQGED